MFSITKSDCAATCISCDIIDHQMQNLMLSQLKLTLNLLDLQRMTYEAFLDFLCDFLAVDNSFSAAFLGRFITRAILLTSLYLPSFKE